MAWFMIHGNTVQYTKHARKLTKTLYVCTLYDRTIFWCFILQKYNFVVFLNAAFHYSISPYAYTNEQTLHCQRQLSLSLSHLSTAPLVIFIVIQRSVSQSVSQLFLFVSNHRLFSTFTTHIFHSNCSTGVKGYRRDETSPLPQKRQGNITAIV